MNEYEAAEVLNGIVGNALSAQAIFFTALSAYLAVAFTVGKQLTRYQVIFVNIVFILMFINMTVNQYSLLHGSTYYIQVVEGARAGDTDPIPNMPKNVNAATFLILRSMLFMGALTFMWNIRHPKAE